MAVYRREYRGYTGETTASRFRFLILPRYSFRDVFASRLMAAFYAVCFVVPVGAALFIYLHHNAAALLALDLSVERLLPIDSVFFFRFLTTQSVMAFLLTAFVGPGLVSPDLIHNALPLYLSRPFSRKQYVLGKMTVLLVLLSFITWIPGLLLCALQASLEGTSWLVTHWRLPVAIVLGSWIWILILSLLALAISAWVKWRPVAAAMLLGVFFVAAGFGSSVNLILETRWGHLLNLGELLKRVWIGLFFGESGREVLRIGSPASEIPLWAAWICLLAVAALCLLLLNRRLRAYEVVR